MLLISFKTSANTVENINARIHNTKKAANPAMYPVVAPWPNEKTAVPILGKVIIVSSISRKKFSVFGLARLQIK